MKKIAFIGAGSFGFTRNLVKDILTFSALEDAEIRLMDIDPERLGAIEKAINKIVTTGKYPAKVVATTDRAKALEGADGVVITILQGGVQVWRKDIEIPMEYGVDINVGDTRGPSGVFRALRTIPVMLDIARDIEKLCPKATVLNYTNPMAMLCRAVLAETNVRMTGLCHSVQGTASMIAKWIGAPEEETTYLCAGINHQAWYLEYKWNDEDAYPLIRKAMEDPEVYNHEQVRNEMFLHLDYYVTESSGHNSEYNPWFRKRKDLIEKYCTNGTGWNPGVYAYIRDSYLERENNWKKDIEEWLASDDINLERGHEYAASIFNATIGDHDLFEFNGNMLNKSLITNLPEGCCVEVPVVASQAGFRAVQVGDLPDQLAVLNNISARCEELAVEGALTGDPRKVFHSILFDPLTSAMLSMAETKEMVDKMFEANADWLPDFKHTS
jgi:alpha-galactosidase